MRWMAERSVHLLSRKPFIALVTHMSHLVVYSSAIFPPAALDYAKALRTLLSYPPHLDNLDQTSWKVLMGICWSAILGDPVAIEGGWEDEMEEEVDGTPGPGPSTQAAFSARGRSSVTQATNELAMLIPILLSSSNAPILPPFPPSDGSYEYEPSIGFSICHKIQRFFATYPAETSSHLAVLRSLNLILETLELNCLRDFVAAGHKILPYLVDLWLAKSKGIREQVLVAIRTLLPWLTLETSRQADSASTMRVAFERLLECLPKETTLRWGFEPLDLGVVRLALCEKGKAKAAPFEAAVYTVSPYTIRLLAYDSS